MRSARRFGGVVRLAHSPLPLRVVFQTLRMVGVTLLFRALRLSVGPGCRLELRRELTLVIGELLGFEPDRRACDARLPRCRCS
jgi:hypothetical protein